MGLIDTVISQIKSGKQFLGICLGLQMLFEYGEEFGRAPGLGLFAGKVVRFSGGLKVPHMGWNQCFFRNRGEVGRDVPDGAFFYFVHSYYVVPEDASLTMTVTDYGVEFVSSITKDNVTAVQFHPEKSQRWGLKLLDNFRKAVEK